MRMKLNEANEDEANQDDGNEDEANEAEANHLHHDIASLNKNHA